MSVTYIEIADIKNPRRGRQRRRVVAENLRLAQARGFVPRTGAGLVMAHINVKHIRGIRRHARRRKLIAHHLAIHAAAGTQRTRAAGRIHRHGRQQLHRARVEDDGIRPVAAGRHSAAFRRLIGAVREHARHAIKRVQTVRNRRDRLRVARCLLQGEDVNRLRRIAADDLLADAFEHAARRIIGRVAGRGDQSRLRGGDAIDVRPEVVGDDAQRPGLRRSG
jgi:hypothetical protein